MNSPAPATLPAAVSSTAPTPRPARQKWFPLLVLMAAAAWLTRHAINIGYFTAGNTMTGLFAATAISAWYIAFGGRRLKTRIITVIACWLALNAVFLIAKPVYNGDMGIYSWRWRFSANPDEQLACPLAKNVVADVKPTIHDYAAFLGGGYWPEVKNVALEADWQTHPPQLVWRHEIGAGWSAFALVGNYAFTQEQRGQEELVTCYQLDTGAPVWTHADRARFDPADFQGGLGGIGPRATPTIVGDRLYTQGATGIVNCLDIRTGRAHWTHDTIAETGAAVTIWGKSGSPLVTDGVVMISLGAPADQDARDKYDSSLAAYDAESGEVVWSAGNRPAAYTTPVAATLAGEKQILIVDESYLTAHRASDGKVLWEYPWGSETDTTASCIQPIPLANDRVMLCKGYGFGVALIEISRDANGQFSAKPVWDPATNPVMKSKFANLIIHDGYAYGLDEVLMECIDAGTGAVQWKKRRHPEFGHGQQLLVGDKILVLSETGELAIVAASPEKYQELAAIQALDPANVTWNNLAFSAPYLVVRNAREAACYRLPLSSEAK
jgi:outer membrane protein assembly factor BamB